MTETIVIPGYPYPIGKKFDPGVIDVSSGEPIVRVPGGYWVWGRGCTQPGGGIVPAWGFVPNKSQPAGTGSLPVGVGATSPTSNAVPALVIGGAILAGLVGVLLLASRDRAKSVDEEAEELFPSPGVPTGRLPRGRKALNYGRAAARCFYRELRDSYAPEDAARIARRAFNAERGRLSSMSHVGRSVADGCALLREYYRPRVYAPATAR
jgi:hypothetical protein